MSKSRGNVVAPDDQVERWGADCFRAYLMFLGPWEQGGPYDVDGIVGVSRWLHRLWTVIVDPPALIEDPEGPSALELRQLRHRTAMRVTEDLQRFRMNTMIAALMEATNALQKLREGGSADRTSWNETVEAVLLLLAPSCPHLAEELWERTGHAYSVHTSTWPSYDASLAAADTVEIAVQVNGRVRERLELPADADEAAARAAAEALPRVAELLEGKSLVRVVYVPGRLLNIVVR
jgi:leucyl-tRNA synthetase